LIDARIRARRLPHNSAMKTKLLLMAAAFAFAGITIGADQPPKPEPIPLSNGAFFALSVKDIQASGAWYREKLGLKVTLNPPRSDFGEVMVLEGGGLIVELIQTDKARALSALNPPVSDPFELHGFFKAGVLVEDFDATLATLKERGVPIAIGPFAAKEGRRANFIIEDNAGNLIHFFGK
jgi:catechol 2,3-dioxygenase-like lactoylglutathione lyase family enzyme